MITSLNSQPLNRDLEPVGSMALTMLIRSIDRKNYHVGDRITFEDIPDNRGSIVLVVNEDHWFDVMYTDRECPALMIHLNSSDDLDLVGKVSLNSEARLIVFQDKGRLDALVPGSHTNSTISALLGALKRAAMDYYAG